MKETMTVGETVRSVGVTVVEVYRRIAARRLAATKDANGRWCIAAADVAEWIERRALLRRNRESK